ncbi:MAG: hypothetical protein A2015_11700 [Spirochaetes bacterium GWF1_31_7]|nr:MAG: hypothetical protein A2Y30_15375 [Spirochaetes bacterium GWE1_32_154]OHD49083.1 MAG: hypothetical protein A2015_11700 [Spirochaetes bacterium GWF1_31_7]OHD50332.1 MAG: hypothetical protein A2Y29_13425 [Spirochaetes bacterium GWE2_31_10]OHD81152.1 MAG: hypothetical protein A2355_12925 [Spirochaetes bacterium RIFOXYB1_FULL_32_8]HBD93882.1 hypothetical protein [Spirochaetia bacterium]
MSMDDELRQILSLVLTHNEDLEKLHLYIKLKNGNVFKYKVDKVKEMKILRNIQRRIEKEKIKKERKHRKIDQKFNENKTDEN